MECAGRRQCWHRPGTHHEEVTLDNEDRGRGGVRDPPAVSVRTWHPQRGSDAGERGPKVSDTPGWTERSHTAHDL
ncbi:hypothetical protein NDU88_002340 [Pleurodeles waltl]|uniref:Uncharacterized protein n=1 Tax=Pleurodeles waltl TaxID=8319 RepID=A0AAV7RF54_PLEWA|nr:hypothetical protein NDU88_002340 [Pleurodeles waltl]